MYCDLFIHQHQPQTKCLLNNPHAIVNIIAYFINVFLIYKEPDLKHRKVNSNFLPWLQLFSKLLEKYPQTIFFLPLQKSIK